MDNSHLLNIKKNNEIINDEIINDEIINDEILIVDKLHNYIKSHFLQNDKLLVMLNEIIFYGAFVYYYYFGPIQDSNQTFLILKYIIVVFCLRYFFNYITSYTVHKKEVNYFQINSKIAIFAILILFLTNDTSLNNISSLILIFLYALLSSCAQYGYTVDNFLTLFVIYSLFKSKILN